MYIVEAFYNLTVVKKKLQDNITLYPIVDESCEYLSDKGERVTGEILAKEGVDLPIKKSLSSVILRLKAV